MWDLWFGSCFRGCLGPKAGQLTWEGVGRGWGFSVVLLWDRVFRLCVCPTSFLSTSQSYVVWFPLWGRHPSLALAGRFGAVWALCPGCPCFWFPRKPGGAEVLTGREVVVLRSPALGEKAEAPVCVPAPGQGREPDSGTGGEHPGSPADATNCPLWPVGNTMGA